MTNSKGKTTRRVELLKAARGIFAEKGYEATTVSEIVTRAGVAQGTFYLYFPSKVSIAVELAGEVQEKIKAAILEAYAHTKKPEEWINKSIQAAFDITGQYRDVLGVVHSSIPWSEHPRERERIFSPYYDLISDLLEREKVRGNVSPHLNTRITATLIVGLVYYAIDECYLYDVHTAREIYIEETMRFIRHAMGIR
ncbi:MAG: TetR family transcriptional regulator [Ktedonobacteraceae bacterium]|nr:TetR family transcriptional regulator [Ktedonobacteraceae bacterium]